ncbi:helix-turn-helix transcriptional regulator [Mucilaginibacter sp. CAU 1740]|uniref:helix-turn-helix domain-containing protein n=1 Tax=Mucilaginibacter sp. CAU 1740 TaxID=3140365 RepID=UPI00325A8636
MGFHLKPMICLFRLLYTGQQKSMVSEKDVALRIRTIRESKNYSHYYVAYKLNISQNTFSKIELGNVKLTVDRFLQIAKVLDVSPAELLLFRELPELAEAVL